MIIRIQGVSELQNQIYYDYDTDSVPLGQGGMGVVYPGRCFKVDNSTEYIPVAIKLITNTAPDMIERAMREASIQIDNPNLLRMYGFIPNMEMDLYTHEMKPRYYIAMERLDGVSLETMLGGVFCAQNGIDISYARNLYDLSLKDKKEFTLKVMKPILNGVNALHQAGYIHRDLDPSNIMITQDDGIKIIDYGVCKPLSLAYGSGKLTMTGSIIGKVDYAAPELLSGDVQHHSFTTDIYAIGIMMYRLYVGNLPFEGDNSSIMKAHLNEDVPVDKIADPLIKKIVAKATRKMQEDRYQSIGEILEVLENENTDRHAVPSVESEVVLENDDSIEETRASKTNYWLFAAFAGMASGIACAFIV